MIGAPAPSECDSVSLPWPLVVPTWVTDKVNSLRFRAWRRPLRGDICEEHCNESA